MKVVIFTPGLVTGGAEIMASRLATNIKSEEVEVVCLSKKLNTNNEKKIEDSGIKIHYLGKEKGASIRTIIKAWKLLSKIKPNVIHSHISGTIYAIPWIFFHKCKLVHTIHTKPDVEFSRKISNIFKFMIKKNKMILVAVSKENHRIAKEFYGFDDDKVKYVNNPVEIDNYYKKHNRLDNKIIYINVSRQDLNKNQILMIRAMKLVVETIPHAHLVLIGDGNQHEILIEEVKKLGLQEYVTFTGEKNNVEDYLAQADIYLSTSHREGLPLSMLEAMASELPIISTNVGGIPDIINDNGILIEDDNLIQLVDAMKKLAKDSELRLAYGKKSIEIVKNFDSKECGKKYVSIYYESLNNRGKK